jgi:hypothetical protein
MNSHKLSIKIFTTQDISHEVIVPVFHRWIQQKSFPNHLLVDVADYAHVPEGPGTLLVSHEANIHLDHEGGKTGVLYVRKQPAGENFEQNFRATLRGVLTAAAMLQDDAAVKAKFDTKRLQFRIHDRLNGPNSPKTFEAVKGDLERVFGAVYGSPVKLAYKADPERLFQVDVEATTAPDVKSLEEGLIALRA